MPCQRRLATFPLLAAIVIFCSGFFALPVAPALGEGDDPLSIEEVVKPVPPSQLITHEKGSLHWKNYKPDSGYTVDESSIVGTLGDWTDGDDSYWQHAFKVVGDSATGRLPEYTARFDDVLTWVNPTEGTTDSLDFECHFKALEAFDDFPHPDVAQVYVNGFFTTGIKHAEVTYKFYDHKTKRPIDPGLLVYWCRSLNPDEAVGFSQSKNEDLSLAAAYLTNSGIYGEEYVNEFRGSPAHWETSSVKVVRDGDMLKFTGSDYLFCSEGSQVDLADTSEIFWSHCDEHTFDPEGGPIPEEPDYIVHGHRIPYSKYIQYRAVTFDVDPCDVPDANEVSNDGITLDYFTETDQFYWTMEFNGIMVTRHLPTKSFSTDDGEMPLPGDLVTFDVTQSLEDIPEGLVDELVFTDTLDEKLERVSATMLVDGEEVPDGAGAFELDGQKVTYRFGEQGLKLLKYAPHPSACTLRITARVGEDVAAGTEIPNHATVTMNDDDADTPEVKVIVGEKPDIDFDVEPAKGQLVIRKKVLTPNNSGTAAINQPVQYIISVNNDGNPEMKNVTIQDSLPEGIALVGKPRLTDRDGKTIKETEYRYWEGGISPEGDIEQIAAPSLSPDNAVMTLSNMWAGQINVKIPTMKSGDIVHIEFDAAVTTGAPPLITNRAIAKADDVDPVAATASFKVKRGESGDNPDGGDNTGGSGTGDDNPGGQNPSGNPGGDGSGGTTTDGDGSSGNAPGGSGSGGDQSGDDQGDGNGSGSVDGSDNGDAGDGDPNDPSDADGPSTGDRDNAGGNGGSSGGGTGGTGGGTTPSDTGGSSGSGGSSGGVGTGGTAGGTGTDGTGGTPTPAADTYGAANAPATLASDASQQGTEGKNGRRLLPQTDTPPVIGIATTGGIGMTGALVAHSIWSARNRRR